MAASAHASMAAAEVMSANGAACANGVASASSADACEWVVHKFGGTSLAAAECYANSADIVRALPVCAPASASEHASAPVPSSASTVSLRTCVVVSAMGEVKGADSLVAQLIRTRSPGKEATPQPKVTNELIRATELAARRDPSYLTIVEQLRARHTQVVHELLGTHDGSGDGPAQILCAGVLDALASDFADLAHILRSVWLSRAVQEHQWWFGMGELWSARLMHAYLTLLDERAHAAAVAAGMAPLPPRRSVLLVDAREVITLQPKPSADREAVPDYVLSETRLREWLQASPAARAAQIIVVTGYLATTADGHPTTLGRDGSDFSASIMAALLRAREVTIWTDVDGCYSANPAAVRSAVILPHLSYHEASELAYYGAKIIHPKTMTPVVRASIPVWIRNTFNAQHPGTFIGSGARVHQLEEEAETSDETSPSCARKSSPSSGVSFGVRGFSEVPNLSLVLVEGTGLIGVPGVCSRLFTALREAHVSVVLITQSGSEHSICIVVPAVHSALSAGVIRREFRDELESGEIQTVGVRERVSCLAIVGDGMRSRPGAAARMFAALAHAGVNVVAIAQGASERNISVIVDSDQCAKGLLAVHQAFIDDDTAAAAAAAVPNSSNAQPSNGSTNPNADAETLRLLRPLPVLSTLTEMVEDGGRVSRVAILFTPPGAAALSAKSSSSVAPSLAQMRAVMQALASRWPSHSRSEQDALPLRVHERDDESANGAATSVSGIAHLWELSVQGDALDLRLRHTRVPVSTPVGHSVPAPLALLPPSFASALTQQPGHVLVAIYSGDDIDGGAPSAPVLMQTQIRMRT